MFSDGFSEGQARDINGGFPTDTLPYTESYDYLSDSDLEDDESEEPQDENDSDTEILVGAFGNPKLRPKSAGDVESHHASVPNLLNCPTPRTNLHYRPMSSFERTGKVAIIRDIAAVT